MAHCCETAGENRVSRACSAGALHRCTEMAPVVATAEPQAAGDLKRKREEPNEAMPGAEAPAAKHVANANTFDNMEAAEQWKANLR